MESVIQSAKESPSQISLLLQLTQYERFSSHKLLFICPQGTDISGNK